MLHICCSRIYSRWAHMLCFYRKKIERIYYIEFRKEDKACNRLKCWITTVGENTSSNMHQTSWRYASYSDSNFYFTSSLISPLAGLMDHVMNQKNQKNKSWSPAVACSCTRRQPPYISWISNAEKLVSQILKGCAFSELSPRLQKEGGPITIFMHIKCTTKITPIILCEYKKSTR